MSEIEPAQHGLDGAQPSGADEVGLVEHEHVGELGLVDEQVRDRVLVAVGCLDTAFEQGVAADELGEEPDGVHDGDHGVEAGVVGQAGVVVEGPLERRSDRSRFGDAA